MQLKYATAAITTTVMIMAAAGTCASVPDGPPPPPSAAAALPLPSPPVAAADSLSWAEVIECYKRPRAAIGCLESRMGRALAALRDSAVTTARSDPDTAAEDAAGVGELVQQIGEFIKYSVSSYFRSGAAAVDDDDGGDAGLAAAAGSGASVVQVMGSDVGDEGEFCPVIAARARTPCHTRHLPRREPNTDHLFFFSKKTTAMFPDVLSPILRFTTAKKGIRTAHTLYNRCRCRNITITPTFWWPVCIRTCFRHKLGMHRDAVVFLAVKFTDDNTHYTHTPRANKVV